MAAKDVCSPPMNPALIAAVVKRRNQAPVSPQFTLAAARFRGSMRELFQRILSPKGAAAALKDY